SPAGTSGGSPNAWPGRAGIGGTGQPGVSPGAGAPAELPSGLTTGPMLAGSGRGGPSVSSGDGSGDVKGQTAGRTGTGFDWPAAAADGSGSSNAGGLPLTGASDRAGGLG